MTAVLLPVGFTPVPHTVPRESSAAAPPNPVTFAPSVAVVCPIPVAVGVVSVGSVTIVCAPPAVVEPLLLPAVKVKLPVVSALTLIVLPPVGVAAISAVIKIYPVLPALIVWFNEDSECEPVPKLAVIVPNSVSLPVSSVLSAEYHTLKLAISVAA